MNAKLRPVPDSPPRAVLYLRQSVARDDSISIELQEIAGRDYCAQHGYEVVAVEIDEGISGRTWSKRPAVQRVMDMIESKNADVIVLWKWSRLSRSRKDWALAADRVDIAGGRIESATEPIDTATASGRFARGVMTEYAAFQSEQIGEQWAEVRQRRFNLGLPPSGALPWGWIGKRTHIEPHPIEAEFVKQMYQLYLEGNGWTSIASWANQVGAEPRRSSKGWLGCSIRKILDSPIHAGLVVYHGEIREGQHEGIISREVWDRYQALRHNRHVPIKIRDSNSLLSSIIICHCGRKRYGRNNNTTRSPTHTYRYNAYVCPSTLPHPPRSKGISQWKVDKAIILWVKALPKITAAQDVTRSHSFDTERYAREITANEKRLVKLTEHLLAGLVPEAAYRDTRDNITAENARLQRELDAAIRASKVSAAAYISGKEDLIESIEVLDLQRKRTLLRSLIANVTVDVDRTLTIKTAWGETTTITT